MITDKKIIKYKDLASIRRKTEKNNQTIVFTSGCYDILHLGHIVHFNFCKSIGDILVISLGSDSTLRELKGPTRPINNQQFRARLLAALELVDYVVISEESGVMDHTEIVKILKPDFYVVPSTDKNIIRKEKLIKSVEGKLIICKRLPPSHMKGGISTTKIARELGLE